MSTKKKKKKNIIETLNVEYPAGRMKRNETKWNIIKILDLERPAGKQTNKQKIEYWVFRCRVPCWKKGTG